MCRGIAATPWSKLEQSRHCHRLLNVTHIDALKYAPFDVNVNLKKHFERINYSSSFCKLILKRGYIYNVLIRVANLSMWIHCMTIMIWLQTEKSTLFDKHVIAGVGVEHKAVVGISRVLFSLFVALLRYLKQTFFGVA